MVPDVDGPAELAEEGDGDEEEDDVQGSFTEPLFGSVEQSFVDVFRACRFGIKIDRSEDRLSLELLFRNASSCCCC